MNKFAAWMSDRRNWGSIVSLVAIAIAAILFFYPDDVDGNILRQHDTQQGIAIGQEAKVFHETTGETTRWTNSLFSGMPTFQISPSYPSNKLFTWLDTLMGLGLPYPANLLAMMMLGFFILLMALRVRVPIALLGALAYGFSSYFIILIGAGHIWKFVTLAYVPPTIAGLVLCYRGRYIVGGALAALFAMLQIASNHVQMTYYFLFVVVGFVVAYLITAIREKKIKQWGIASAVLAVAAILAVAANLPSLYNTYEYSKETMRGNHSELTTPQTSGQATAQGLDRNYITQYSYNIPETWSLLIPNINGGASIKPEKGTNKFMTLYDLDETQQMVQSGQLDPNMAFYLNYITQYYGAPEGTNGPVYVGALIFALFLLGCVIVKGPMKWMLLLLTLFSITLAWGRYFMGFTDFMIDFMPMYSKFRTVESILVIAEFTMPLLAVMALQRIFSVENPWKEFRIPILVTFGFTLLVCLLGIADPSIFGSAVPDHEMQSQLSQLYAYQPFRAAVEKLRYSLVTSDSIRSLLIVAAGMAVILLYTRRILKSIPAMAILIAIVAIDLFTVNHRYVDHDSFLPPRLASQPEFPMTEADRMILADTTSNYRVMDIPHFWEATPSYRHKAIGGYHAAKLTRYQDLIDRHLSHFTDGTGADETDMEVLNMLNARYIVVDTMVMQNPQAMGNAWFVDNVRYVSTPDEEMNALSAIDLRNTAVADKKFESVIGKSSPITPGDSIFLTSYAPNRLTYSATTAKGSVAVFSEVFFPWGWHATIDGQPAEIGRANYLLRAIDIPAGHHRVEMWFDPQSLKTTGTIAYVAIILIYLSLLAAAVTYAWRMRQKYSAVDA